MVFILANKPLTPNSNPNTERPVNPVEEPKVPVAVPMSPGAQKSEVAIINVNTTLTPYGLAIQNSDKHQEFKGEHDTEVQEAQSISKIDLTTPGPTQLNSAPSNSLQDQMQALKQEGGPHPFYPEHILLPTEMNDNECQMSSSSTSKPSIKRVKSLEIKTGTYNMHI